MLQNDLDACRQWFDRYCRSFLTDNSEDRRNIELKIFHTDRVFINAARICSGEGLDPGTLLLAQAAGLLHDVGRFPQYARYKTYRDSISVNHGKLGAEVIAEENILSGFAEGDRGPIMDAVRFHNAFRCPELADPTTTIVLRVVRDSDKLDIWKIFCDLDDHDSPFKPSAAMLDLPELPDYSDKALQCLEEQRLVTLADLTTVNDFRLMQLSWTYDLNYSASFLLLNEQGFIDRYAAHLPATAAIIDAVLALKAFVAKKITTAAPPLQAHGNR